MFRILRGKQHKPTITEIIALQNIGVIGTIESRNWIALEYPNFAKARREDVDSMIEDFAAPQFDDFPEEDFLEEDDLEFS